MENLSTKQAYLYQALQTLEVSIASHSRAEQLSPDNTGFKDIYPTREEMNRAVRDSMIQRFEYCCDLFWKYLKDYLETVEKIELPIKSPRSIFRALCQARLISEQETNNAIAMAESRNMTSHIYKEEVAALISSNVAKYHDLMTTIIQRIKI